MLKNIVIKNTKISSLNFLCKNNDIITLNQNKTTKNLLSINDKEYITDVNNKKTIPEVLTTFAIFCKPNFAIFSIISLLYLYPKYNPKNLIGK
jgi:hypothetical protein